MILFAPDLRSRIDAGIANGREPSELCRQGAPHWAAIVLAQQAMALLQSGCA
jgi:hypothetical protein